MPWIAILLPDFGHNNEVALMSLVLAERQFSQPYLGPSQTSMMILFVKTANG